MSVMQAILRVKIFCVIYFMPFFSGFELLIFLSEYGAMSSVTRKLSSELTTRSNTRRAVRQQKMTRGLKFKI